VPWHDAARQIPQYKLLFIGLYPDSDSDFLILSHFAYVTWKFKSRYRRINLFQYLK